MFLFFAVSSLPLPLPLPRICLVSPHSSDDFLSSYLLLCLAVAFCSSPNRPVHLRSVPFCFCFFCAVIPDLALGVSLAHNPDQVAFRWYPATLVLSAALGALPSDITSVEVLLCSHRNASQTDVASLQLLCPWTLASAVPMPQTSNLTVSFGGAVGAQAPRSLADVFSLVVIQSGGPARYLGQSPAFRLLDIVSGVQVVGLGAGGSDVYNGYGGWAVRWVTHPSLGHVLGHGSASVPLQAQLRPASFVVLGPVEAAGEEVSTPPPPLLSARIFC